jgi:hypothetical protein
MTPPAGLAAQFTGYERRLGEVANYASAVMPYLKKEPGSLRVFIDGVIVLSVSYLL